MARVPQRTNAEGTPSTSEPIGPVGLTPVAVTPKTAKHVFLGLSEDRVLTWTRRGLPFWRDGKARIIRVRAIEEFIAKHEVGSALPSNDDDADLRDVIERRARRLAGRRA